MGLSTTTTIFLFIICLCGGIVIGAMFSRLMGTSSEKTRQPGKEEEKEEKPAEPAAPEIKSTPDRPGDVEVLRAWRNVHGNIWLEMTGHRLETRDSLTVGQKIDLRNLVLDLRPWLEVPPTGAPHLQKQETPPPVQPARRPSIFSRQPKVAAQDIVELTKPAVNLKSIVEQIDEVLQEKLAGTAFSNLEIHLLEGSGGEVLVQIGSLKHPGVDAIPNPEIQALIRLAIKEWEARAT